MDVLRVKGAIVLAVIVTALLAFDLYKAESQPVDSTIPRSVTDVVPGSPSPSLFQPTRTDTSGTSVQQPASYSTTP